MIQEKIKRILKPYFILVLLFIIAGYLFKVVETFQLFRYQDSTSFVAILQSYLNITAVFCLYALIILPVYLLIGFLQQKIAQVFASIFFSIFILLEIGLYIYYKQAGVLMGAELIVRPLSEILTTVKNSSNLWLDIISITAVITFFVALPFFLKKIKVFNSKFFLLISMSFVGIFSICTIFYQKNENRTINNYLESKSFYFFSAVSDYLMNEPETVFFVFDEKGNVEKIEKNEQLLKEYAALYPHRTISDLDYPMERPAFEIPDVLSAYFNKSEKQPNIVIIIVESLGSYLMGEKGKNLSFTPFLDSLARVGLYWKNCLTTTPRTFGVLPAVIGSVPHGMRGFQFGIMPQHHSLFSILKNNNYSTNFFYGGDASFDSMLDFLIAEETDHIDNFLPQMKHYKKDNKANWWGVYDHVLFEESFKYLKTSSNQKPNVNVYLTISSHEAFGKNDQPLKDYYETKTEKILSKISPAHKKDLLPVKDIIAPFTYLDDSMRDFINNYSKHPDFENTIFIITGDHSYGYHKNVLAYYSVPLIIWSPLLKTPKTFPNIVSHWGITPSVTSYLQNNYDMKVPEQIAWCSDGLDTTSVFNPSEKILFLNYDRKVNAMVYHQYLFKHSENELYMIDENLDLKTIENQQLMEEIDAKFNTLKYVNHYVYHNNKLIKSDNKLNTNYKIIKGYENKNTIVCKTPDTIPSLHGIDIFDLMPVQKITGAYKKIKIKLQADLIINDFVYQDKQMVLIFNCTGKNLNYVSNENITKYIEADEILCDKKYELSIEKEIDVNELDKFSVHIYVATNEYDANWMPDKKITLSNIKVFILGK